MSNYFINQFTTNFSLTPPFAAEQKLAEKFPLATAISWFKVGENYEAVFNSENRDCIAQLNSSYDIASYKIITPVELLPENIKQAGTGQGKITNAVLIWDKGKLQYELAISDPQMQQFKVLLDANGNIVKNTSYGQFK